jgi:hypothetical protein
MEPAIAFVVLPLVLHRETRLALPYNTRTTLTAWIFDHPDLVALLPQHARDLRIYTERALSAGLSANFISFRVSNSKLTARDVQFGGLVDDQFGETSNCIERSRLVGRWFSKSGSAATIFSLLGVRP